MASYSFPSKEDGGDDESITMPNWIELPMDITTNILKRLDTVEIVTSAYLVCSIWWNICKDPLIRRSIHMKDFGCYSHYNSILLNKIWRYAVKQSCGQLEEIDFSYYASDDLLQFIADKNGNNLRRMRLFQCHEISAIGFSEAVMKFPHLEEVEILHCNISKDSVEALGHSCPLLNSLVFIKSISAPVDDDELLSISKTMPKLCRLVVSRIIVTNVNLLAILDGCPLLKTLIIQGYPNPLLTHSLKRRCREQIEEFILLELVDDDYFIYDED